MTTEAPTAPSRAAIRFNPTRPRDEAIYDHAYRHSRRVNRLKIILPLVALIGVAGFFGAMRFLGSIGGISSVSLEGIDTHSKSLVMNKPHISGFKGTEWAYEVTADKAIQDIADPKLVTLERIEGQFGISGNGRATVHAASGLLNGNANTLALKGGITVTTTNGYSATLVDAAVDITKGNLASSSPVVVTSKDGTLHANEIEVTDSGKLIVFRKGVSMSFVPPDTAAQPDADASSAAPAAAAAAPVIPASTERAAP